MMKEVQYNYPTTSWLDGLHVLLHHIGGSVDNVLHVTLVWAINIMRQYSTSNQHQYVMHN